MRGLPFKSTPMRGRELPAADHPAARDTGLRHRLTRALYPASPAPYKSRRSTRPPRRQLRESGETKAQRPREQHTRGAVSLGSVSAAWCAYWLTNIATKPLLSLARLPPAGVAWTTSA